MFGLDNRRQDLRDQVEDWLHDHPDPADPLTTPVRLLMHMFLAGTDRGAVFVAGLAGATLAMVIGGVLAFAAIRANDHVTVPTGERAVMQEWIDSGEPSRLMQCNGGGLAFVAGRCRTVDTGGWLIPLAAQQALPSLPLATVGRAGGMMREEKSRSPSQAIPNASSVGHHRPRRTFSNPFGS